MTFEEEMKQYEDKLRGIKAPRGENAGHSFKRSSLSKRLRGKSDKAPKKIYDENMRREK